MLNIQQQKEQLHKLTAIIANIESCTLLADIDPKYYDNKRSEYETEYRDGLKSLHTLVQKQINQ